MTRLSQAELIAEVTASWRASLADPGEDPELAKSAAACLAYEWHNPEIPWTDSQIAVFRTDMALLERKLAAMQRSR